MEMMEAILESGPSAMIVAVDSLENKPYPGYQNGFNPEKTLGLEKTVALKKMLDSDILINLRIVVTKGINLNCLH
jgi:hypothetical protein